MTSLITKQDIENELQTTLGGGYFDSYITGVCDWAHARLRHRTSRTAFSGDAAEEAKFGEIYLAINRIATTNRDLTKLAIQSISENGASITFSNGKTSQYYHEESERIISELALRGTYGYTLEFPDIDNTHTGTEGSVYY